MTILSNISETAIITLRARITETREGLTELYTLIDPPLLHGLEKRLPPETVKRVIDRQLPATLTRHIGLRARKYDRYTKSFLKEHPDGLVVSLGSGFDTRYWRISDQPWKYVEIDLPAVIDAKKEIMGDKLNYTTIACSVTEYDWIRPILGIQNKHVLFLAEGLFMYLPQPDVEAMFKELAQSFSQSTIVFEVVNKKYTSGFWKKMVEAKMKRSLGSTAGASYQFGVENAAEVEMYGEGINVIEEWSYFEDEDIKPGILKIFKNIKYFSRTQWTIKADLN